MPADKDGFIIKNGVLTAYAGSADDVIIPDGVKSIQYTAFSGHSLRSVHIPGSVEHIGAKAFYKAPNLCSVTIENGVKGIAADAFKGCVQLDSLVIPSSVENISFEAFAGTGIESLTVAARTIGLGAFAHCGRLLDITLTDGVECIEQAAFAGCRRIERLVLPDSVKKVEKNAFWCCTGLRELTCGRDTVFLADAFYGCANLPEEQIPTSALSSEQKMERMINFLENPGKYDKDRTNEIYACIKRRRHGVFSEIAALKNIPALTEFLEMGFADIKCIDRCIEEAEQYNDAEMTSLLLKYKSDAFTSEEIRREQRRQLKSEINYNPNLAKNLRKTWLVRERYDGTLSVSYYRGTDNIIDVPGHIGKKLSSSCALRRSARTIAPPRI